MGHVAHDIIWCIGFLASDMTRPDLVAVGAAPESGLNLLLWAKAGYTPVQFVRSNFTLTKDQIVWKDEEFFSQFGNLQYKANAGLLENLRRIPKSYLQELSFEQGMPRQGRFSSSQKSLLVEAFKKGELSTVSSVSHVTVRRTLKKAALPTARSATGSSRPGQPPSSWGGAWKDVRDIYAGLYHPAFPVLWMDKQPLQLPKETRTPIPAAKGQRGRVDYVEYERAAGTASLFAFTE